MEFTTRPPFCTRMMNPTNYLFTSTILGSKVPHGHKLSDNLMSRLRMSMFLYLPGTMHFHAPWTTMSGLRHTNAFYTIKVNQSDVLYIVERKHQRESMGVQRHKASHHIQQTDSNSMKRAAFYRSITLWVVFHLNSMTSEKKPVLCFIKMYLFRKTL